MRTDIIPLDTLFEANQLANLTDVQKWLGTRIVKLTSGHFMVLQKDGAWLEVKDAPTACQKAGALWTEDKYSLTPGGPSFVATKDGIKTFLMAGEKFCMALVPLVSGTMMVPGCDTLAIGYRGHRFINIWHDTLMKGEEYVLNERQTREDLETLLRMIREALCGRDDAVDWATMMNMLHHRDPSEAEFRVTMSWLAAPFQDPGRNLVTNLWQLGPVQGMGRGTLQGILRRLYGGNLVLTASFEEFNRGWTDQMNNRLLICMNEVGDKPVRHNDMDVSTFCKQYANEDEITVATRYKGIGAGPLPNFVNYMGTGNSLRPMRQIDESDRRHQFIATSTNKAKKVLAQRVYEILALGGAERAEALLQAFAFVLRSLKVEEELIQMPLDTDLRNLNVAAGESDEQYWLAHDDNYQRDRMERAAYWAGQYNQFHQLEGDRRVSSKAMSAKMMALTMQGAVEETIERRGKRNSYRWLVSSQQYPRENEFEEQQQTKRSDQQNKVGALHLAPP